MDFPVPETYEKAEPFPHAVIDGFFDETLLRQGAAEFPSHTVDKWRQFKHPNEMKLTINELKAMGEAQRAIIKSLMSPDMVEHVSEMTGIEGLIPILRGGGLHMTMRDGFLDIHADFNRFRGLYRRINALLFLNEAWDIESILRLRIGPAAFPYLSHSALTSMTS